MIQRGLDVIQRGLDVTPSTDSAPANPSVSADAKHEPMRVTPEELALAAASLESKRDAEHTWREKTLPLEEAIEQLGLNVTPEELCPEVEAIRAERAAKKEQERKLRHYRRALFMGGLVLSLVCLLIAGVFAGLLIQLRALHRALHPATLPIQPLALVPDNVPVHIDSAMLINLASGDTTPDKVFVFVDTRPDMGERGRRSGMFNNEWTIVKSEDLLSVRAWARADQALQSSNNQQATVFSNRPAWLPSANVVPIQLPLYRFASPFASFASPIKGYTPNGAAAEGATSVLQGIDVPDTNGAISAFVTHHIVFSDEGFSDNEASALNYIDASVKGDVVHLTGRAESEAKKQRATELAKEILQRFRLPFTVTNEME
ncbi:MAG TPA: BON domain-containing protein [Chthonomonadaceae bacterium]|nr:BON domain-containing protein [Chthonomonadaceae bacterium]